MPDTDGLQHLIPQLRGMCCHHAHCAGGTKKVQGGQARAASTQPPGGQRPAPPPTPRPQRCLLAPSPSRASGVTRRRCSAASTAAPCTERRGDLTDRPLGSFPQRSLFPTGKPPAFYLKAHPHLQIHSSPRNTIAHGHHNGNESCSGLRYHSLNRSVLVFIRRNTRPKKRERRLVKKLHTQSKRGAKTHRQRFAFQYFTNTSLVNETDNQSVFLSKPGQPQISFCSSYREPPASELKQANNQALFAFFSPLPAFLGKPGPSL